MFLRNLLFINGPTPKIAKELREITVSANPFNLQYIDQEMRDKKSEAKSNIRAIRDTGFRYKKRNLK